MRWCIVLARARRKALIMDIIVHHFVDRNSTAHILHMVVTSKVTTPSYVHQFPVLRVGTHFDQTLEYTTLCKWHKRCEYETRNPPAKACEIGRKISLSIEREDRASVLKVFSSGRISCADGPECVGLEGHCEAEAR